jgi:hypothetical protein
MGKRYEVSILVALEAESLGAAQDHALALMLSAKAEVKGGWDLLDLNAEQVDLEEEEA